ncbi:unnamed protein product, partial [Protopolystoma xenopodis]
MGRCRFGRLDARQITQILLLLLFSTRRLCGETLVADYETNIAMVTPLIRVAEQPEVALSLAPAMPPEGPGIENMWKAAEEDDPIYGPPTHAKGRTLRLDAAERANQLAPQEMPYSMVGPVMTDLPENEAETGSATGLPGNADLRMSPTLTSNPEVIVATDEATTLLPSYALTGNGETDQMSRRLSSGGVLRPRLDVDPIEIIQALDASLAQQIASSTAADDLSTVTPTTMPEVNGNSLDLLGNSPEVESTADGGQREDETATLLHSNIPITTTITQLEPTETPSSAPVGVSDPLGTPANFETSTSSTANLDSHFDVTLMLSQPAVLETFTSPESASVFQHSISSTTSSTLSASLVSSLDYPEKPLTEHTNAYDPATKLDASMPTTKTITQPEQAETFALSESAFASDGLSAIPSTISPLISTTLNAAIDPSTVKPTSTTSSSEYYPMTSMDSHIPPGTISTQSEPAESSTPSVSAVLS